MTMPLIPNQRALFDVPDEVAYLRCAATSPTLRRARRAGERALAFKSRPWGTEWNHDSTAAVEEARALFASMISATADDIALVPSASYGLSTAAHNLPIGKDKNVVVLADQFPSNVYPWQEAVRRDGGTIRTVSPGSGRPLTPAVENAIDENTAVVAVPQCHWLDGTMLDLAATRDRCRQVGAALVLDLSQSLGVVPFDVRTVDPDFAVSVAEKWLLGPVQLAFLYVAPRRQSGKPIEHSWVGRDRDDARYLHDYSDTYRAGARRYDVGERTNIVNLAIAIEGLSQINAWTIDTIAPSIAVLIQEIVQRAEALGFAATPERDRAPHIVGLRHDRAWALNAQQQLEIDNVLVSLRGDVLRVAPHLYNNERDIDALIGALGRSDKILV